MAFPSLRPVTPHAGNGTADIAVVQSVEVTAAERSAIKADRCRGGLVDGKGRTFCVVPLHVHEPALSDSRAPLSTWNGV